MRNLMQYPITTEEITDCLRKYLKSYVEAQEDSPLYGDINGVCLQEAIERVCLVDSLKAEIKQCAVELEEAAKLLHHAAHMPSVASLFERAASRARQTLGEQ